METLYLAWALLTTMMVCATVLAAYAEHLRRERDRLKQELEEMKRHAEP